MENPDFKRSIRSFVLRQGHLSTAQQRAMDEGMPKWGIEYRPEAIDLEQAFGRAAPKILEIGFGMGGATAEIAAANPDKDYLGIEVHGPGVGNLCKLIAEKELTNLRLMRHDAVEVLDNMLPDGCLDGVHIFFPDPWHKKRHNKRRLIQAPLVAKLASKLKPGGYFHAATDWEDYAIQILEVLNGNADLENTADGYAPRPDYRPLTKFEARGIKLGHGVWDVIFRRK
ncbi:tRNA (guanosine(46)-N7)-methyltransferase TrmB [Chromobacterium amazonense]|uniref:tRNA (guanine-N(7)-)-methyltransferase n=1 Tax=Chromobacterium amazonense TaxID=1382803 RepID=A0A2S9X1A7_9NEIS|nr:tRNA (guanosine(46)-N7)-methyltransferase TrmB [Chromobacterium amazonense]MBM2885097.1 tRNA (guanosine(46)-N7)-methyltransferase TrmB [Chromobacterium amazonense]MDE1714590.1 tRNA (guanosine(46)-N7)-methyltransferase TrmB [Chromobacterium amazonense]PRP69509.1 tRNA (guanosine(46)-N7)-methyltransferase TrmB [Chromobacterium amazonense]